MPELYIGLDAGGSKTKLVARSGGQADIELIGPAANLQAVGKEKAARIFSDLVRHACAARPDHLLAGACAGVSGAGRPDDRTGLVDAWRNALGRLAPERLIVVHDAVIAIEAAFEGSSGVIAIVGTGSIAYARSTDGQLHRIGGWGYLLGDEGSGYAIGLSGLRAVAAAMDGGPGTRLQALVAEHYAITTPGDLINRTYQDKLRMPDVAPLVLQAAADGDDVAHHILREQSELLARQVSWLLKGHPAVEPRLAFIGGLSKQQVYRDELERAILARLPGWQIVEPALDPAEGALRLAMHGYTS